MKVATVWDSSVPLSMMRRHKGMISVWSKKLITFESSTLTSAPITPRDVNLRYSKLRPFDTVFKKGYKNSGMWALRNSYLVSLWLATHYSRANTLQALLEIRWSRRGGLSKGYTLTISCNNAAMVPTECQIKGASSEKCSLYWLKVISASSLLSAYLSSSICLMINSLVSSETLEFVRKDYYDTVLYIYMGLDYMI